MIDATMLTKAAADLLLYLEARAADYGGVVDPARMSEQDAGLCRAWSDAGFIRFGRVRMSTMPDGGRGAPEPFCWVELTPESWAVAHALRERSAARALASRTWEKAPEPVPKKPSERSEQS